MRGWLAPPTRRAGVRLHSALPESRTHQPWGQLLAFAKEHNERDVVLSPAELDRLLAVAPWVQPIIIVAYDSDH